MPLPDWPSLAVFLTATVALNLSPGPDMLYVISRSLDGGRKAGVVSALGIGAGTIFHIFIAALGVSALLLSFPAAYQALRYAGAVYLVYLGVRQVLRRTKRKELADPERGQGLRTVFRQGVTTNILNPKVALFFLAFLPQFVDYSKGSVALQIILLGVLFDCSGTSWNVLIGSLAGHVGKSLGGGERFSTVAKYLPGFILVAIGVLVAVR